MTCLLNFFDQEIFFKNSPLFRMFGCMSIEYCSKNIRPHQRISPPNDHRPLQLLPSASSLNFFGLLCDLTLAECYRAFSTQRPFNNMHINSLSFESRLNLRPDL